MTCHHEKNQAWHEIYQCRQKETSDLQCSALFGVTAFLGQSCSWLTWWEVRQRWPANVSVRARARAISRMYCVFLRSGARQMQYKRPAAGSEKDRPVVSGKRVRGCDDVRSSFAGKNVGVKTDDHATSGREFDCNLKMEVHSLQKKNVLKIVKKTILS